MIAYITGKLAHKEPSFAIIEANGVGYEIRISLQTYGALPERDAHCKLYTYLNIREDAHLLYGFVDVEEKQLFLQLTSVSGVGPATALVMLSSLSAGEIAHAILTEDARLIQTIKGIGGKTAQRIILELKDKVKKDNFSAAAAVTVRSPAQQKRNEALAALTTLGIARPVAEKSIDAILKREGETVSVEQLIKLALR